MSSSLTWGTLEVHPTSSANAGCGVFLCGGRVFAFRALGSQNEAEHGSAWRLSERFSRGCVRVGSPRGLIPFISDAASTGDGLITYCALCVTRLAGVIVTGGFGPSGSFSNAGATGAIVPAIVCAVVAGAMSGRIRKKHRQRDQARFDADAED